MTKHILKLNKKEKGLPPLSFLLRRFYVDDIVVIKPCPKYKKQLPCHRFFGKMGKIISVLNPNAIKVQIKGAVKRTRSIKYVLTSNLHLKLIERSKKQ